MIVQTEIMELLLKACPSFAVPWSRYIRSEYAAGDQQLLYVDLGEFARHLVNLYKQGQTEEFGPVFDVVERLHKEGDAFVREAATIGLLEGIQNVASHSIDSEVFVPFLGPESTKWWNELNAFWQGKQKYVGQGLEGSETDRTNTA